MGQMIEFKRPDGSVCGGYLVGAGKVGPGGGDPGMVGTQ